jgi:hypothetical protein
MIGRSGGGRERIAGTVAAAAVGAASVIAVFHPGYMSSDSIDQLRHARMGLYLAVHAPLMGWLWRHLDQIVAGPMGMLIFQNAVFWGGLALIAYAASPRLAPLVVLVVGFYPSVFAELGTIWKDVHMGAALVLASGLLVVAARRRSLGALSLCVVALWYANSMRANASTAVLPLAVAAGAVAAELAWPRTGRAAAAGAAVMAFILAGTALTNATLHAITAPPLQAQLVHDLVGISAASRTNELPAFEFAQPGVPSEQTAVRLYQPETLDPLFFGPNAFRQTSDPGQLKELRESWASAVRRHPRVYLSHRLQLFGTLIGARGTEVWYPYHWQIDPNDLGVVLRPSALNAAAMRALAATRNWFFFRAWIHLAVAVAIAAAAILLRRGTLSVALAASALLYTGPYLFVAPSPDFRYVWWPVVATLLSVVAFAGDLRLSSPKPTAEPRS